MCVCVDAAVAEMSHSQGQGSGREKESRHLWVGGLPDDIDEAGIKEYFTR